MFSLIADMIALHEALEANDFLEVYDELAIEVMRQYEMGRIWDPDATDLEKAVLKTRPELSEFNAYDFAGIIYRDYNSRVKLCQINISVARYKDLLIGALYELKQVVNDFEDVCDTIGLTPDEREYFDI